MDKMEFQQGNPQEDRPKRIEKKRRRKWLWLTLTVVLVLAVVATALLWDATAFDGLRRSFIYARAQKDENGCAQLYRYAAEKDSCFASLQGSLVRGSTQSVQVLGEDGEVRYSTDVKLRKSAVCTNGEIAVVYDIGGTDLYVLNAQGLVHHLSAEGEIISCTINQKNMLAVTLNKSGYKASVVVYDAAGEKTFAFHSSDRFLMTAALDRDGRQMAAVTMGQTEGSFASSVVIYRLDSDSVHAERELPGGAVYDIGVVDGSYCAVSEDALFFVDGGGTLNVSYDFDGGYLRRCCLDGKDFAALLLGRYKSGTQARLVTVDENGEVLGEADVNREVLSMSAAGKYVAVLYSDELVIYDRTLQICARLEAVNSTKQVLMRDDGSAVLVGTDSAGLYLP